MIENISSNVLQITTTNKNSNFILGDYLKIVDSNSNTIIFGKIINIISNLKLQIQVDDYILNQAQSLYGSSWIMTYDYNNYHGQQPLKLKNCGYRNLFQNYDSYNVKGWKVEIFDSKYINVTLNSNSNWFIDSIQAGWHGIIVSILNQFNQLAIHIYDRQDATLKTNVLKNSFKEVRTIVPQDLTTNLEYELVFTPLMQTNIRLLKTSIEAENHSRFLNQNIISNSANALLIDNADARMITTQFNTTQ